MQRNTATYFKSCWSLEAIGLAGLAVGLVMISPARAATYPPAGQDVTLYVNTTTGDMQFLGDAGANMSFYTINSASSSLNDADWVSFQSQSILNPSGAITTALPGQIIDWMEMANSNSILQDMACANMMPGMNGLPVIFDTTQRSYTIGDAFQIGGQHDLTFTYDANLDYSPDYIGAVVYESGVPEPASAAVTLVGGIMLLLQRRRARFR